MHKKSIPVLLLIASLLMITNVSLYAQCNYVIPTNAQNLCNPQQSTYTTNTGNTITINDPSMLPAAGTYNVTYTYYDQSINTCVPTVNCPSATISTSGASVIISLGSCATLPSDFSASGIIFIKMESTTGGPNYFYYVFGGACSLVLPITLSSFNATVQTSGNIKVTQLTWQTASESNSLRFDVMRSSDGANFYRVGQVAAAGNSNTTLNYSFTDYTLPPGNSWYKLRLVDIDGACDFSTVILRTCNSAGNITCAGTLPAPGNCGYSISGPLYLCDAGAAVYTLSADVPDYSTIAWSVNPSDAVTLRTSECNTKRVVITRNYESYTPVTLSATLSRCNYPVTTQIYLSSVPSGTYSNNGNIYPLYTDNSAGTGSFEINISCPNCSNLQWQRIEGNNFYSVYGGGKTVDFSLSSGQYMGLEFTGSNDCGSFDMQYYFDASGFYSITPNPATSMVTIKPFAGASTQRAGNTGITQIQLYDGFGTLQKNWPGGNREQLQIDVSDMKPGLYLLKIMYGNKVQTKKLRIK